jgi:hypothetical protein
MHVDISTFENVSVRSFDIVELRGRDSIDAAVRAIDPKAQAVSMLVANSRHKSEMIAAAITHVNGEPVVRPHGAWEEWNLRTQEMVNDAFDFLNSLSRAESDDFLAQLRKARAAEVGSPTTAPSGPR